MTSNALITGEGSQGGALGFATTGSIDWVAFGKSLLTVSTEAIQRFASAGVQPATCRSVMVMCCQFRLSYFGEQRLQLAIKGLSGIAVNSLYMGFGYRCLARELWEQSGGVNCVALCACLAEAYTEAEAAWILTELWRLLNSPDNFAPSHAQLKALVKACAGVTAKTPFSEVINNMQSAQYRIDMGVTQGSVGCNRGATKSKDVAKVLLALFRVSHGYLDNITIIGGSECAFVAALASWLFDLRLWVEDDQQTVIFKNVEELANAQVYVRYGNHTEHSAVVTSTTYTLPNCFDVFDDDPEHQNIYLISRHPWDGCLSALYGIAFEQLQQQSIVLGNYLGSVARIYEALALGEKSIETISFLFDSDSVDSAYGLSYVNNILSTFPELGRIYGLQAAMISAAQFSFEEALQTANTSVVVLEGKCACVGVKNPYMKDIDALHHNETSGHCIASIAFAIRDTARLTARIVKDPWYLNLKPTIAGLVRLRQGHQTQWKRTEVLRQRLKSPTTQEETTALLVANAIGFRTEDGLSSRYRPKARGFSRLLAASLLFQGSPPPATVDYEMNDDGGVNLVRTEDDSVPTAISMNGICCYDDILRSLSSDAKTFSMVHVIPGCISYQDRRYDSIRDPRVNHPYFKDDGTGSQIRPEDFHKITAVQLDVSFDACVTELSTGQDLQFFYRLSATCGTIILPPRRFAKQLLYHRRKIFCDGISCGEKLALPCTVMSSFGSMNLDRSELVFTRHGFGGNAGCIWPCSDDKARCMILAYHLFRGPKVDPECDDEVVLRDGECLPCCTASYFKKMSKEQGEYFRMLAPNSKDELGPGAERYQILHIIT
ncbi:hypothetical protein MMC27_002946 [Xylographa pallens]|nr:hypothetical protein [Xylographa pallens]